MSRRIFAVWAAGLLTATAFALPLAAQPAMIERTAEMRSTVETVDARGRTVLLRDPTGGLVTFDISREVPDLARIRPGDQVIVNYRVALAASMARPGTPPIVDEGIQVQNPPRGSRPGERTSQTVRLRVRIEAVDPVMNTVDFVGPRGVPRRVVLGKPQMQDFARGLRPGDEVEIAYTEAQAIRIVPAPR